MKCHFLVLFLLPAFANAQKLLLLDRNFQEPISIVDTITMEKATKGGLAIYARDINTILSSMQKLIKYVDDGKMRKEEVFDLKMGNSKCIVKTEKTGSNSNYNIVLNTNTGNFKTAFVLVAHETNKRAVQRLTMFMDYLQNNLSVLPGLEKL
jgi:hypothetical protein